MYLVKRMSQKSIQVDYFKLHDSPYNFGQNSIFNMDLVNEMYNTWKNLQNIEKPANDSGPFAKPLLAIGYEAKE